MEACHTLAELRDSIDQHVGKYNYVDTEQVPDVDLAIKMANLKPGERVLDLGCAGARVTAAAKLAVAEGLVVGLDGVPGFLTIDAPAYLTSHDLTVAPAGTPAKQVHLVQGNIMDENIIINLTTSTGQPAEYDVIFLVHVFQIIPACRRRDLFVNLKRMLAPGGRIIMNMPARFATGPIPSADLNLPAQFQVVGHTQARGSAVLVKLSVDHPEVLSAGKVFFRQRIPIGSIQLAPERLWTQAEEQAYAAAAHVGLRVLQTRHIGKSDNHNFAHDIMTPTSAALSNMSLGDLQELTHDFALLQHQNWGPITEVIASRIPPSIFDLGFDDLGDCRLFALLDGITDSLTNRVMKDFASNMESGYNANAISRRMVDVMVELRI